MVGDPSDRAKQGPGVGEEGDGVGGELERQPCLLDHLHLALSRLLLLRLEKTLVLLDYRSRLLEYGLGLRKHVLRLLQ